MGPGTASGYHKPVQIFFSDSLLNFLQTALRTRILILLNVDHSGQAFSIFSNGSHIQRTGDIGTTMANKNPDPQPGIIHSVSLLSEAVVKPSLMPVKQGAKWLETATYELVREDFKALSNAAMPSKVYFTTAFHFSLS
jgi:hypothetical protein